MDTVLKQRNDLNASQIMKKVVEIVKQAYTKMVSADEMLDLKNEVGGIVKTLQVLNNYKEDYKQRHSNLNSSFLKSQSVI